MSERKSYIIEKRKFSKKTLETFISITRNDKFNTLCEKDRILTDLIAKAQDYSTKYNPKEYKGAFKRFCANSPSRCPYLLMSEEEFKSEIDRMRLDKLQHIYEKFQTFQYDLENDYSEKDALNQISALKYLQKNGKKTGNYGKIRSFSYKRPKRVPKY